MVDELRRLLGEATPTGWIADDGEYEGFLSHDNTAEYATLFRPGPNNHRASADARLIAAAVNALPRLLAVCEAARDARDVWYATDRERSIDAPEREEMYALCRALDAMKEVHRG